MGKSAHLPIVCTNMDALSYRTDVVGFPANASGLATSPHLYTVVSTQTAIRLKRQILLYEASQNANENCLAWRISAPKAMDGIGAARRRDANA